MAFGRTGEPLTFRLHYAAYQRLENVVVGIGLDHQNGQHLSGTNTRRHGRAVPVLEGDGYVDYAIPELSLLEGTYELTAAIQDWTEAPRLRPLAPRAEVRRAAEHGPRGGLRLAAAATGGSRAALTESEGAPCRRSLS